MNEYTEQSQNSQNKEGTILQKNTSSLAPYTELSDQAIANVFGGLSIKPVTPQASITAGDDDGPDIILYDIADVA